MTWEPLLRFDCDHVFRSIGPQYRTWYSSGADQHAPASAPLIQKKQCNNCGGVVETVVSEKTPHRKMDISFFLKEQGY